MLKTIVSNREYSIHSQYQNKIQGRAKITRGKYKGREGIVTFPTKYKTVMFYSDEGCHPYCVVLPVDNYCLI